MIPFLGLFTISKWIKHIFHMYDWKRKNIESLIITRKANFLRLWRDFTYVRLSSISLHFVITLPTLWYQLLLLISLLHFFYQWRLLISWFFQVEFTGVKFNPSSGLKTSRWFFFWLNLIMSQTKIKSPRIWRNFLTQKTIKIHYLSRREIP